MTRLQTLAARRLWVYGGGLATIVGLRALPSPQPLRVGMTGLVLAVMVLTYVGEQFDEGTEPSPLLGVVGFAGVAAGSGLALTGRLPGLVVLAGGVLFLRRALGGDGR